MTQEVQQALYDSIVRGNSIGEACREVGVSKTTYAWWRNRGQHANCNPIYHNFRSMMQKAIEERDRQARNVRSVTPSP
jgi:transposase-like protein